MVHIRLEAGVQFNGLTTMPHVKMLSDNSELKLIDWFIAHPQDQILPLIIQDKDDPNKQVMKIWNDGVFDTVSESNYSTQDKLLINKIRTQSKYHIYKCRWQRSTLNPDETEEVYLLWRDGGNKTRLNTLQAKGNIKDIT